MELEPVALVALAAALLATGLIAGLIAGLIGVGGGIVIVPVLFHVFGLLGIDDSVRMHLAIGTSLATIVATSIASTLSHHRRGAVDTALLSSWGPAIFVGTTAGAVFGSFAKGPVLTAVFAVVALAVAANMAFRSEVDTLSDTLPTGMVKQGIGIVIGAVSAVMGIGGGTLSVPILTACSYPIRRAVGTAAAIGLIIAVPGSLGFAIAGLDVPHRPAGSVGYVNLIGFAMIVPATIVAAPWGARLTHTLSPIWVRRAFAVFLFLTAIRMFYGLFAG